MPYGDWRTYRSLGRGLASLWEREEASLVHKQRHADLEKEKGQDHANHQQVIEALQRIENQNQARANRDEANERSRQRWERRRIWLDVLAVLAVFVAAGFAAGQWHEMKTSGVDTHNLAVATGNLASAAKSQASDTAGLRKATQDFAAAMKQQAASTAALANATVGQLQEMQAEQRPIIALNTTSQIPITPFFYTENAPQERGRIAWSIPFSNIGRSTGVVESMVFMKVGNGQFQCVNGCARPYIVTIMNPGQANFTTGIWPTYMTKTDFDEFMRQQSAIIIYIAFRYSANGQTYRGSICQSHDSNNTLADCSATTRIQAFK